jgi:hypothetical protein
MAHNSVFSMMAAKNKVRALAEYLTIKGQEQNHQCVSRHLFGK